MAKIVFFTGSGISAESGLNTYRDLGGIWEQCNVEDVATKDAWKRDRYKVTEFHNKLRKLVREAKPNVAHEEISRLGKTHQVSILTQNIDDLHERAGSDNVLHLHGEIMRARSTSDPSVTVRVSGDLSVDDRCPKGSRLRPDVVWFGEEVAHMDRAIEIVKEADALVIVGTSLRVYPASDLVNYVDQHAQLHLVDPSELEISSTKEAYSEFSKDLSRSMSRALHWKDIATVGVPEVCQFLRDIYD